MKIPPIGPSDAKLAIVGEAPGAQEERLGLPFVGASGHLLDELLARNGHHRELCYITNVVKTRPRNNDFSAFYDKGKPKEELVLAREELLEELERVKPNAILALGNEALRALTGRDGITKWRGSILDSPVGKVIPSIHPAFVLRQYEQKTILNFDIKRAIEQSEFPERKAPKARIHIWPSFSEVMSFLESLPRTFTFDIETQGERVRCLGLGISREEAMCIPFIKGGRESYWPIEEEKVILGKLWEIFRSQEYRSVAQNFPFDATILEKEFGFEVRNLWMDTMVAQHCCYSELPKSLDFLCSIYTEHGYYAGIQHKDDNQEWIYNGMDCIVTYEVMEKLILEMKNLKVEDFYRRHAHPVMITLAKMSNRGLLVDKKVVEEMRVHCKGEIEKALAILPEGVNPASPKQLKEYLFGVLKMKPYLSKGKVSTDEEVIEKLISKYPKHKEVLQAILTYRGNAKLISTYLDSTLSGEGRLTTAFHATGTVTGRVSSRKTIFGEGGNLQNLPRGEFRRIFIAPEGFVLVKADLAQAESRAVAWDAGIRGMVVRFKDPTFDVHTWNASIVYGRPESEITKGQRQKSKAIVHGTNYEMGHLTAAKNAGVTPTEAKNAMAKYYAAMPELLQWHERVKRDVCRFRQLRTPFGRLRVFLGRLDATTFRSAIAFTPQSTIADIINQALVKLEERYPFMLICQVHDELVMEVPIPHLDEVVKAIREACEIPIYFPSTPDPMVVPVEIKVGKNWYDTQEV